MQIETERLLLRPFAEADAADLYKYAKDPEVGPAAGWPPHGSVEESRNIIRLVLSGPESYAICKREDGRVIGAIALSLNGDSRLAEEEDECELGYWIGKLFWGQGLMTEASEALLRRAFTELGMRRVWCGYFEGNEKSKRVQEKLGFRHEKTVRDVDVPLLKEVRIEHVSLLSREAWRLRNM
jgi:acetyltransferase, GNAT family